MESRDTRSRLGRRRISGRFPNGAILATSVNWAILGWESVPTSALAGTGTSSFWTPLRFLEARLVHICKGTLIAWSSRGVEEIPVQVRASAARKGINTDPSSDGQDRE